MKTKTAHTPEPWTAVEDYGNNLSRFLLTSLSHHAPSGPFGHFEGWSADGITLPEDDKANAARIVACVNSLRAFPDPAKDVPALVEALRASVALLDKWPEADLKPGTVREAVVLENRSRLRSLLASLTAGSAVES